MAIHVFDDGGDYPDRFAVWTDVPDDPLSGRCIGVGRTFEEARADALRELHEELQAIVTATDAQVLRR